MTSEDFYKKYLMPLDFTFGRDERIPTLASALIAPYRTAKRVRFNAAGDIMDPTYAVYNYNNRNSAYSFKQVSNYYLNSLLMKYILEVPKHNDRKGRLQNPLAGAPNSS